jgi:hypothetical protein
LFFVDQQKRHTVWTVICVDHIPLFTTSPNPWTGAPCSLQAYMGRIRAFPRMLSLNRQKAFDGTSPRLDNSIEVSCQTSKVLCPLPVRMQIQLSFVDPE